MFLSIGVSRQEFEDSYPKDLECYVKAEEMRRRRRDAEAWEQGYYNLSAVTTAISRVLNGKKSHAKYLEEPLLEKAQAELKSAKEDGLTEDQKKLQRDRLLMSLMTMQANFELNQGGEG